MIMRFLSRHSAAAACHAMISVLIAGSCLAADFEVTRTDDPVPDGCVSASDCSLREAIIAANLNFDADRILLPSGTYNLTIVGADEDLAATGDLDHGTGSVEIRGLGATPGDTVIDAAGLGDRILDVLGGDARILNLTLRGGSLVSQGGAIRNVDELTIRRVVFDQNSATSSGGAVHSSAASARVTIEDSSFTGNTSLRGGAIRNEDASTFVIARTTFVGNVARAGGAIYNQDDGAVTLSDCHLEINRAEDGGAGEDGGAIYTQNSSSMTIVRSVLHDNLAEQEGGAIFVQNDSALTIVDTTISDNVAIATGGGLYAQNDSAVFLHRTTISGNHSDGDAGGVFRRNDGQLLMHNSTVSGNTAGGNGGGLRIDSFGGGAIIALESSTITDNSATGMGGGVFQESDPLVELRLHNTIIADNTASAVANDCATDGVALLTSIGFNLDSTDTCGLDAITDLVAVAPLLGALADNGGPTRTHALLANSPAIGAGTTDPLGPTIDQRGVTRPGGGQRDIGAVEFDVPAPTCPLPLEAVEDRKELVPTGQCTSPGEADKTCSAWVSSCRKVARAAAYCRERELSSEASLDKASCKLSPVPDPDQCRKDVNAALKLAKDALRTERGAALDECDAHLDDCVAACQM